MLGPKSLRKSGSGAFSWITHERRQVGKLKFKLQEVKSWAIFSAALYKPFRVIYTFEGDRRVAFESDDKESCQRYLRAVQAPTLQHGDAVSVDTAVFPGARHWALYDAELHCFWEYQGDDHSVKGQKARVVATPEADFYRRVEGKQLRIETLEGAKSPAAAVARARGQAYAGNYNVVYNNCESFVRWSFTGSAQSEQSKWVKRAIFGVCVTALAGSVLWFFTGFSLVAAGALALSSASDGLMAAAAFLGPMHIAGGIVALHISAEKKTIKNYSP